MPYIPKTIPEVADYLVMMFLSKPGFADPIFPAQNLESVFAELGQGLDAVRKPLGDGGHERLVKAASQAKALCEAGDHVQGTNILQHMHEYIRLKKYRTDEDVIDDSRFEN